MYCHMFVHNEYPACDTYTHTHTHTHSLFVLCSEEVHVGQTSRATTNAESAAWFVHVKNFATFQWGAPKHFWKTSTSHSLPAIYRSSLFQETVVPMALYVLEIL